MLLRKKGYPEEGEFVLSTVTNIQYHSVFVKLDEYGKSGMIHISEISPGRIRNIRDFVKGGKKVVCVVLRITPEKGHIDLSLRRVNESQRRLKISQVKQQQLAEKIIENIARKYKLDVVKLFDKISDQVLKKYPTLHSYFEDIVIGKADVGSLGLEKEQAELLLETIKQRIKPPEVWIGGDLKVKSYSPDGLDIVKTILKKAHDGKDTIITYDGGGKYRITVRSEDYKKAEKILDKALSSIEKAINKDNGEFEFSRKDK